MSAPTICQACGGKIVRTVNSLLLKEGDEARCDTCNDPVTLPRYLVEQALLDMRGARFLMDQQFQPVYGVTERIEAIEGILHTQ